MRISFHEEKNRKPLTRIVWRRHRSDKNEENILPTHDRLNEKTVLKGGIQTPLFLNTPTFSSIKLYQNAILHIYVVADFDTNE